MVKDFFEQTHKEKQETSVLNTDKFDKRRFNLIYEMSKSIQELEKEAEFPLCKELLGDIWAGLFKVQPKIKEVVEGHLLLNHRIMEQIMREEAFLDYRNTTMLDDMSSAIGTLNFGKQTIKWIKEQARKNEQIREQLEQIQQLTEQRNQQVDRMNKNNEKISEDKISEYKHQMNEFMSSISEQLFADVNSSKSFSRAIQIAIKNTIDTKKNIESLIGGIQSGTASAELKKIPLRDKIQLAEILSDDKDLKEIAKWAGKFKRIARNKQKVKTKEGTHQSGIEMGNDLERVLPNELLLLSDNRTRNDFLKRYAEGRLIQYEQKGRESLGEGSIIVCLDQSGSMEYDQLENISKAFTLSLISIARRQKRNFVYIPFDSSVGNVKTYVKGKIKAKEMIELARGFLGGGTDFEHPLKEAIKYIKKDTYKDADIILITDGEAYVSDDFLKEFRREKNKKKFHVLSLTLTSNIHTLEEFSDRVIQIENFDDKGAYEAFEI